MVKGIDVSGTQKDINWKEVKKDGIKFAILKIGNIYDAESNYVDSKFERNYEKCLENNISVGIYVYNYCNEIDTVIQGAEWIIEKLRNRKLQFPIYIDMEDKTLIKEGRKKLTDISIKFMEAIQENGYKAGVYANLNWFKNYLDSSKFLDYSIWVAQTEVEKCDYTENYDIWQFTHTGKINGIVGNVDVNYLINMNLLNVNENNEMVYIVQPGDNLTQIANKYNTTWQKIYTDNKIVIGNNPDLIQIGTKLIIKEDN